MNDTNESDSQWVDEPVRRQYRALSVASSRQPSRDTDDKLLAAARSAVAQGRAPLRPSVLRRWQMPIALAASVVVTLGLVSLLRIQAPQEFNLGVDNVVTDSELRTATSEEPVTAPAQEPEGLAQGAETRKRLHQEAKKREMMRSRAAAEKRFQEKENRLADLRAEAGAMPQALEESGPRTAETLFGDVAVGQAENPPETANAPIEAFTDPPFASSDGMKAKQVNPVVAPTPSESVVAALNVRDEDDAAADRDSLVESIDEPGRDPGVWVDEIYRLVFAGKTDEAEREWRKFRKQFPQFDNQRTRVLEPAFPQSKQ